MKILLVSMNFSPELTGIGKYSGEMAAGLVARGHEVTVVCAPPYYPRWEVQAPHSAGSYVTECPMPGLTVLRCPIWIPRRLGGVTRLLHLASFALSSVPAILGCLGWQPRVVFVVAPALFCAPAAWLAAQLTGARAWLHIQDFEIDAAFELGLLKQPLLRRAAQWAERRLMRRFDAVSTISGRMLRLLHSKGVSPSRTSLLPNWIDVSKIQPTDDAAVLRDSLAIAESQVVCLYSGTLNRKSGLDVLVATARLLECDPRVVFVICGNGEMRQALEASAAGLDNIRFVDLLPAERLNALLNMADIHLLPQLRGAADLVMPSKLVGMLASGRPVIAAAAPGTEIASIVSHCGLLTEPECADGFRHAVVSLVTDATLRQRLGAAGRAYAEAELDAEPIFERLHDRLEALNRPVAPAPLPTPVDHRSPALSLLAGFDAAASGPSALSSERLQ